MARIGNSWVTTSWAIPAWADHSWQGIVGNPVVANTVSRLGSLFRKTALNVGITEAPLAVKKFLDDLKVERKKVLTEERRKLASLKQEVRKTEERLADLPIPVQSESPAVHEVLQGRMIELQGLVSLQASVVRAKRKELEEAEQARIDQLAEFARQEWMREEEIRKAEAERVAREDEETMQILLLVHEL